MKKLYILIAVAFSFLAFCTKDNPTEISAKGIYSDSIVIDLFSYRIYSTEVNTYYCDSLKITAKGQPFLKQLDSSIFKIFPDSSNYFIYAAIVPKYIPSKYEAWVYDSMAMQLQQVDSTDPNVVAILHTLSSTSAYVYLDTSSINSARCIRPIGISYIYGYGFILGIDNRELWGIGKIKIYYK
jgi:hypothetical protein